MHTYVHAIRFSKGSPVPKQLRTNAVECPFLWGYRAKHSKLDERDESQPGFYCWSDEQLFLILISCIPISKSLKLQIPLFSQLSNGCSLSSLILQPFVSRRRCSRHTDFHTSLNVPHPVPARTPHLGFSASWSPNVLPSHCTVTAYLHASIPSICNILGSGGSSLFIYHQCPPVWRRKEFIKLSMRFGLSEFPHTQPSFYREKRRDKLIRVSNGSEKQRGAGVDNLTASPAFCG